MGSRGESGADAFGRWVGISVFAFWAAWGQPRKLLRSSSGAKSRGVSHEPASSPTTSSPARASGRAATPPTAPSPTMTTSVFLRSMAMIASLRAGSFHGEHRLVISRFAPPFRHPHALLVGADRHSQARIADQVPADEIRIAPVIGIAERALEGVGAGQIEERCGIGQQAGGEGVFYVGHR